MSHLGPSDPSSEKCFIYWSCKSLDHEDLPWTLGGAKDKANGRCLQGVIGRDRTGVTDYSREKVESVLTEAWRKCCEECVCVCVCGGRQSAWALQK